MSVRHLALAFVAVFGSASLASATPITYNYTGTAFTVFGTPTGIFAGQGTSITGTFTFDDGLVDSIPGGSADIFRTDTAANLPFNSVWNITLTLGAVTVTTASNANSAGLHHYLLLNDLPLQDQFTMAAQFVLTGDDEVRLQMRDGGDHEPEGIMPGSDGLTGTMAGAITILNNLNPATFNQTLGQSFWSARNNQTGLLEGELSFTLTSISPAQAVPEPASLLLFGAGLAAAGIRRHRRKQ